MTTTINAKSTGIGGLDVTCDASGALGLQTGGVTALTIDTSQNVGIGTTSPSYKLDVVNSSATAITQIKGSNSSTTITSASVAGAALFLTNSNNTANNFTAIYGADAGENVTSGIAFINNSDANNEGTTAFMTRPSGGSLTERMRIDSSGNLLVGKTTTSIYTAGTLIGANDNLGYMFLSRSQSTNTDITLQVYSTGASANRFYVGMGGTVYATSTTITGISDQRVKENIVDLDDGLDAVMALKPRKFDWKEGKGKNIKGDRGFIAQEFETVFPDMIEEWKDPAPEGEEPYKAVNANLIPTLVKAIQEQQTIINDLKARIETLESK